MRPYHACLLRAARSHVIRRAILLGTLEKKRPWWWTYAHTLARHELDRKQNTWAASRCREASEQANHDTFEKTGRTKGVRIFIAPFRPDKDYAGGYRQKYKQTDIHSGPSMPYLALPQLYLFPDLASAKLFSLARGDIRICNPG